MWENPTAVLAALCGEGGLSFCNEMVKVGDRVRIEYDRPRWVRLGTPGSQSMFHGCTGVVVENPLSEPIKVELDSPLELDGQRVWRNVYEEERNLRVLDPVERVTA